MISEMKREAGGGAGPPGRCGGPARAGGGRGRSNAQRREGEPLKSAVYNMEYNII